MSIPSISYISQMLANPQAIDNAESDQLNDLKKTYPYFIPGYFLEAALIQQQHPFSARVVDIMHTTNANWLLFHEFLEKVQKADSSNINAYTQPETTKAGPVEEVEIPEASVMQLAEEEKTVEEDIMAELAAKKALNQETQSTDTNTLTSDFLSQEPGMSDTDLIYEDDFGHLVPLEEDEPIPSFYEESKTENLEIAQETLQEETNAHEHKHPEIETPIIAAQEVYEAEINEEDANKEPKDALIKPIYTEDYFLHEGVEISNNLPAAEDLIQEETEDKSLMVMMSFAEWLNFYKTKSKAQQEEDNDRKALKTMWQKEKLKAALEEENDEIPEQVFEMAVNSITQDDGLASESMADIYVKQGKYDKAIDMYRKLSLRNPQKNTYFARKIEEVLKEKNS